MTPLPPPPPTGYTATKPRLVTSFKQLDTYQLPMADTYVPAWQRVLKECGLPTDVLVLDFETYHDDEYTLGKMSSMEYIRDKRFEILGMARLNVTQPFDDYKVKTCYDSGEALIGNPTATAVEGTLRYYQTVYGLNLEGCVVSAHNASFDVRILSVHFGIHPKYVIDTLALSRAWKARGSHKLKDQCTAFNLPPKIEIETKGWTNRRRCYMEKIARARKGVSRHLTAIPSQRPCMTRDKSIEMSTYAQNDVMRQWELFTILLPKLSNPKTELRLMQETLELSTRPTFRFDFEEAERIDKGCEAEIIKAVEPTGLSRENISGDKVFEAALHDALIEANDTPLGYLKVCKVTAARPSGTMFALAKDDSARKVLARHPSEKVRNLIAARGALDSWPIHISRIRRMAAIALACDGLLPVPLHFHGAHTGRDSGAEKINLQNLPKRGHPLIVAMRGIITAQHSEKLVIVDLAAIEARVLAWIAEQLDLVAKFASNEEVYCDFATKVLGWKVRKPVPEDQWEAKGCIPAMEKRHEHARNSVGKIGILGCGYGMGSRDQADKDQPNYLFVDAGLDVGLADKIVGVYRQEHRAITKFWNDIERAFKYNAKFKRATTLGKWLRFDSYSDCDVIITLPNGRELKYHQVRVTTNAKGREQISVFNETEKRWEYVWGGGLTENVVQAISRDIMMEAATRINDRGFRVAHRVHDELICTCPEAKAEECKHLMIEELRRVPSWGDGMPLNAEGKIATRYGNH